MIFKVKLRLLKAIQGMDSDRDAAFVLAVTFPQSIMPDDKTITKLAIAARKTHTRCLNAESMIDVEVN